MKRYVFALAAVLSFAFGAAGTVLAQPTKGPHQKASHTTRRPSLVPSIALAPHPRRWLQPLRTVRQGHTAKSAHRHPTKVRHRHAAKKRQPQPRQHLRATTLSIYEHTTKPWVLRVQGCSAALRHENGIVILDFGKPAFARHGYGTILFSGRFALNHQITAGMVGYARGYVSCLPRGSRAHIVLARGTSNYHPSVPSAYTAGVRWGRATNKLGRIFHGKGLARHVEAAAADDAEPAWDRRFRKTGQFFHGFRTAVHGHTLYDYGSLDGGIGAVWTARQAWYVAGGLRHTKALPEIYNSAMARQWAELARIARARYHRGVHFAGVMTQGGPRCHCGLRPHQAHHALVRALASHGIRHALLPRGGTNIVSAS